VTYDKPGSYFNRPERPFVRGDSATRPLPECPACRSGDCAKCKPVYRPRATYGGPVRCRCRCEGRLR
jgi:hypothetical protein